MPNNEQKRAAAKRKLQRQLVRRAERARRRQQLQLVLAAVVVVAVVGAGVWYWGLRKPSAQAAPPPPTSTTATAEPGCAFKPTPAAPAAKEVSRPDASPAITTPSTQEVTLKTSQGDIPITLDRSKSPCAVKSFLSLAGQNYFDNTKCHRLTAGGLSVLQCGDPKGDGSGGPGYGFADEYPTKGTVATDGTTLYKRGTLAMANAGPGTNGSQFFLVYKDSGLPPNYTIFGTIGDSGLKVLDKIAAGGITPGQGGPGDGAPKIPVTITGVDIPAPTPGH